mgnify:CR=1 FL=1
MKLRAGTGARGARPLFLAHLPLGGDGRYAVNARSTFAAREGHPLTLKAGETCFAVNTGHPMPEAATP